MSDLDAADVFCDLWEANVINRYVDTGHIVASHCLAASRCAIEWMAQAGHKAEVMPCQMAVFNALGFSLTQQGIPVSEWPDVAWSVGTDPTEQEGRYPGHMVAVCGNLLIDATLGQFRRPQIPTVPQTVVIFDWKRDGQTMIGDDKWTAIYLPDRNMPKAAHRSAGDWKNWRSYWMMLTDPDEFDRRVAARMAADMAALA